MAQPVTKSNDPELNDVYQNYFGEDAYEHFEGDDFAASEVGWDGEATESNAGAAERLKALTDKAKSIVLTPAEQKKFLEALGDIDAELAKIGRVDNQTEADQMDELGMRLEAIGDELSATVEAERASEQEKAEAEAKRQSAIAAETERSKGKANELAGKLNAAFTPGEETGPSLKEEITGTVKELVTLNGVLDGSIFSETERPKSRLKKLPPAGQALDLISKGEAGLESFPAGALVLSLYDTKKTPAEQVESLEKTLKSLPVASRAYLISSAVNMIQAEDPKKLSFLKAFAPEVLDYLNQTIQAGQNAIEGGEIAAQGDDGGYSVTLGSMGFDIHNENTAMLRNDWNGYSIGFDVLFTPFTNALEALGQIPSAEATAPATEEALTAS